MASLKERLTGTLERVRAERSWVDHTVRAVQHYGTVNGTGQAGAVTFFGFLSFFPLLALCFFVIGLLAAVSPELRDSVRAEIDNLLPGLIGNGTGQIQLSTLEQSAGAIATVGGIGILYSGLGWLSGMRAALEAMFVRPSQEKPNLVVGKLRDLAALAVIGLTLILSVAVSALVGGFSTRIVSLLGFDPESTVPHTLLWLIGLVLAVTASTLLLLSMFRLLLRTHAPTSSLVKGAVLGAVGFEVLKALATVLIGQTKEQPAFQAFGVALIVVVWINYFSRLVMLSAAWAYTSPGAVAQRAREAMRAPGVALQPDDESPVGAPGAAGTDASGPRRLLVPLVAAAAGAVGAAVVGRRRGA